MHPAMTTLCNMNRARARVQTVFLEFINQTEQHELLHSPESVLDPMQQFIIRHEVQESLQPFFRLDGFPDLFILGRALQRPLVLNRKVNRLAVHQYGRDAVINSCICSCRAKDSKRG